MFYVPKNPLLRTFLYSIVLTGGGEATGMDPANQSQLATERNEKIRRLDNIISLGTALLNTANSNDPYYLWRVPLIQEAFRAIPVKHALENQQIELEHTNSQAGLQEAKQHSAHLQQEELARYRQQMETQRIPYLPDPTVIPGEQTGEQIKNLTKTVADGYVALNPSNLYPDPKADFANKGLSAMLRKHTLTQQVTTSPEEQAEVLIKGKRELSDYLDRMEKNNIPISYNLLWSKEERDRQEELRNTWGEGVRAQGSNGGFNEYTQKSKAEKVSASQKGLDARDKLSQLEYDKAKLVDSPQELQTLEDSQKQTRDRYIARAKILENSPDPSSPPDNTAPNPSAPSAHSVQSASSTKTSGLTRAQLAIGGTAVSAVVLAAIAFGAWYWYNKQKKERERAILKRRALIARNS